MAQEPASRGPYPDHATAAITFNPGTGQITVQPHNLRVKAGGTLKWSCTGNVRSFEIIMKDRSRTPLAGGKPGTGGVTETPAEAVDAKANGGSSDAANTYRYSVICVDQHGDRHELDPEVVVGPPSP